MMDYSMQQEEEEEEKVHQQIQQRKQQRETQQRLNEAQQAETMLGELGQLFGKMSSLISQQGEVLEKIEDDVEAAHLDIIAGQEELTNLYSLKKGNRPLIIKTFLILNFLIVFMKAYKR
jgi:syntaxin 5